MRLGILDMIGLVATLIFAIPVANFGVTTLLAGKTAMGVALIVVAVAMVVIPQYFMDPRTIVKTVVANVLPRRVRGGDDSSTEQPDRPERE